MIIREDIFIHAGASAVWALVADPGMHRKWNLKVVDVRRDNAGPVQPGERFEMTYRMSGRDRPTRVEVAECEPMLRVQFFHEAIGNSPERAARETYELLPRDGGVELTQTIDMTEAGIPWIARMLIKFIHCFGKPKGEPQLEVIKRLAEETGHAHSQ